MVRVELIDGHGIQGVDRGGKSDPFVVFHLNGQRVFKSQTKKKTLNPEWNENFTTAVVSEKIQSEAIEGNLTAIVPAVTYGRELYAGSVRLEPDRTGQEFGLVQGRP